MNQQPPIIIKKDDGIRFRVFVQPRSSKNEIIGLYNNAIKIKLKAPPVDGAANKMCVNFLAKYLGISKSLIEIISGFTNKTKQIHIFCDVKDSNTNMLINKLLKT